MRTKPKASNRTIQYEYAYRYNPSMYAYIFIFTFYLLFSDCPSKRWSHAMCLSDPETAILIGGESGDQASCKDSIWKLEIGAYHLKIQYEKLKGSYDAFFKDHSFLYLV